MVSLDSLLISGDAKVQLMVSYFKRRARPSQETEARRFAELYFRIAKKGSTENTYPTLKVLLIAVEKQGESLKTNFSCASILEVKKNFTLPMKISTIYA